MSPNDLLAGEQMASFSVTSSWDCCLVQCIAIGNGDYRGKWSGGLNRSMLDIGHPMTSREVSSLEEV